MPPFSNGVRCANVWVSVLMKRLTMLTPNTFPYISQAGFPFIGLAALLLVALSMFGASGFWIGLILLGWVVYFFRDPCRVTPTRAGLIVAPADGKVCMITEVVPEEVMGLGSEPHTRVSIFLNVFDVHVNRSPVDGKVEQIKYRAGKFFNASLDKASVDNERNALAITMQGDHPYAGQRIGVVQIAGLIARRILCFVEPDEKVAAGQRFGLIRFGSRTDIYLPKGIEPMVVIGQRMVGGETIIADCNSKEEARKGEVR